MSGPIPVSSRAANIEYAIRDVVVPAVELESQGHEIIKLNIGDPIAYPGLRTSSRARPHGRRGVKSVSYATPRKMDPPSCR